MRVVRIVSYRRVKSSSVSKVREGGRGLTL
jgi:hypothetical protein